MASELGGGDLPPPERVVEAMRASFLSVNSRLIERRALGGATAVTALLQLRGGERGNGRGGGGGRLHVANVGDARGVLCRKGQAVRLTRDFKVRRRAGSGGKGKMRGAEGLRGGERERRGGLGEGSGTCDGQRVHEVLWIGRGATAVDAGMGKRRRWEWGCVGCGVRRERGWEVGGYRDEMWKWEMMGRRGRDCECARIGSLLMRMSMRGSSASVVLSRYATEAGSTTISHSLGRWEIDILASL